MTTQIINLDVITYPEEDAVPLARWQNYLSVAIVANTAQKPNQYHVVWLEQPTNFLEKKQVRNPIPIAYQSFDSKEEASDHAIGILDVLIQDQVVEPPPASTKPSISCITHFQRNAPMNQLQFSDASNRPLSLVEQNDRANKLLQLAKHGIQVPLEDMISHLM